MTEEPTPQGHVRPTPPGVLVAWGVGGMVAGWLVRRVVEAAGGVVPVLSWLQPLALFLVAAILAVTARATWRQVQVRRTWLDPARAVNRLVLAKACALVGALLAGVYAGYALSWVGVADDLAGERMLRALTASGAGVLIVTFALALERACRVREDDPDN